MNENDLKNKQRLAIELNMKFDEASELFSEETLSSMRMEKMLGGNDDVNIFFCHCSANVGDCGGCSHMNPGAACKENGIICVTGSLELPTISTPTLTKPTLAGQ